MPVVTKTWRLLPHDPDAIGRLAASMNVAPVVAQLLHNRGLREAEAARSFLDARFDSLRDPSELPGATRAADLLGQAIRDGEKITIYGDYDADGITGTAILLRCLRLLGAKVEYYLPNRLEEGYGLNAQALHAIAENGTRWVVTVDCGVASTREADVARERGLNLLVTDHHCVSQLALEYWLETGNQPVHPCLQAGDYKPYPVAAFPHLSGAGVALKLAWLLGQRASGGTKVDTRFRTLLLDAVGLAAIGLIADVVPLRDENRVIAKFGARYLRQSELAGIRAMLAICGLATGADLRTEDIAFKIAPRLNAAGRLGCARLVVELLTTDDSAKAEKIAEFLEHQNAERKTIENRVVAEARRAAERTPHSTAAALVLAGDDWHPGVIGIVAGRLTDLFGRPALVIARNGEMAVGSGRSIPGFPLHEALCACAEHLLSHGGHAAAAGFRLMPDRIDAFREQFCEYASGCFPRGPAPPELVLDAELPLSVLTHGLLAAIDRLEPYGAQNPRPRFLAAELQIVGEPRRVGGGERHLSFYVRQGRTSLRTIAFGMAERIEALMADGGQCCLAFTPKINEWNGSRKVELEVSDFQAGPRP
ncbi:MAG TPA: single-stranded-DNA-specific exonuclease RecJ, partial [Gemmataceae bacterium]|nr:single-stranded-DNA-specific exonuclease RecJ [Gemmataceae bacterium]